MDIDLPSRLRKPNLRRWEASEYLEVAHGVSYAPSTLAKLASVGGGPSYYRCNRTPVYPREELDRWARERLGGLVNSTAQA